MESPNNRNGRYLLSDSDSDDDSSVEELPLHVRLANKRLLGSSLSTGNSKSNSKAKNKNKENQASTSSQQQQPQKQPPTTKRFPKPPPTIMPSTTTSSTTSAQPLYCSRILQQSHGNKTGDKEETRNVYTCECCRPGSNLAQPQQHANPIIADATAVALVVNVNVDESDSNDDDEELVAATVVLVVPDCSPTSSSSTAAALSSFKRNKNHSSSSSKKKNTHKKSIESDSDSSTESEDEADVGHSSSSSRIRMAVATNPIKPTSTIKTSSSAPRVKPKTIQVVELFDSSDSDSDESFQKMVRQVTSRKSNKPKLTLTKVNIRNNIPKKKASVAKPTPNSSTTPATKEQRRKPPRIDDDDNSESSSSLGEDEDLQWDDDDGDDDEAKLVNLMGRVDIQGNNNTSNTNKATNGSSTPQRPVRTSRTTRKPRNVAAVRQLDELRFSDDDDEDSDENSFVVVSDNNDENRDESFSSFIEISCSDDDDDDDDDNEYSDGDGDEKNDKENKKKKAASPIALSTTKPNRRPTKTKSKSPETLQTPRKTSVTTVKTTTKPKKLAAPKKMGKREFQQKRDALGKETFERFNRAAFDGKLASVDLVWSKKLNKTAGITRMATITRGKTVVRREASIELATKVIDDMDRLKATLLHEMCHAADWMIDNNPKPGHGAGFKKWANISMKRVPGVIVTTKHTYAIAYKYAWACTSPKCTVVIQRHSRSVDVEKQCCGRCKGKLVEIELPSAGPVSGISSSKRRTVEHTPKKKAVPSAYNLFIKDQSKQAREQLSRERVAKGNLVKVTQGEVMKECARLWKEKKALI